MPWPQVQWSQLPRTIRRWVLRCRKIRWRLYRLRWLRFQPGKIAHNRRRSKAMIPNANRNTSIKGKLLLHSSLRTNLIRFVAFFRLGSECFRRICVRVIYEERNIHILNCVAHILIPSFRRARYRIICSACHGYGISSSWRYNDMAATLVYFIYVIFSDFELHRLHILNGCGFLAFFNFCQAVRSKQLHIFLRFWTFETSTCWIWYICCNRWRQISTVLRRACERAYRQLHISQARLASAKYLLCRL